MAVESKQLLFFFFLYRSFSASLPSLILVSSHCGVFNASYHMVADSSWRCRGAFIGVLEHSCNNARQGSEFIITQMLALADPSIPPPKQLPPHPTQLSSPSLNTKPQIGWESLLEGGNHKPHSTSDVVYLVKRPPQETTGFHSNNIAIFLS